MNLRNHKYIPIIRKSVFRELRKSETFHAISRWTKMTGNDDLKRHILDNLSNSYSQLQQDLVALYLIKLNGLEKEPPYFVEFGATNGIELSNTFALEKYHSWTGLLCEPSKKFNQQLEKNRNSKIDTRCVYSHSGAELDFIEMEIGEHSSIEGYSRLAGDAGDDIPVNKYKVETVSLSDLFQQNSVPKKINYLSIDTEGSEYAIIKPFDFTSYDIDFISIEMSDNSNEIDNLLSLNGYRRILTEFSRWDGWYIHNRLAFPNSESR